MEYFEKVNEMGKPRGRDSVLVWTSKQCLKRRYQKWDKTKEILSGGQLKLGEWRCAVKKDKKRLVG